MEQNIMLKFKLIYVFLALIGSFFFLENANAVEDSCTQMLHAKWQGTYAWTYRGDHYQKFATAETDLTELTNHYAMTMQIQTSPIYTLQLKGTCMYSQIYFENLSASVYLQGTINNQQIILTGQHGPNVLSIQLHP
jgi:hypothetical protein